MIGVVVGLALSAVVATALPANAKPFENGHEHVSSSEVLVDFCGIPEVLFESEVDIHFGGRSHRSGCGTGVTHGVPGQRPQSCPPAPIDLITTVTGEP